MPQEDWLRVVRWGEGRGWEWPSLSEVLQQVDTGEGTCLSRSLGLVWEHG